jgi:hypothetical protein
MLCTFSARGLNTRPISNGSEIEESPGVKEVGQTSQAPEEKEEDEEEEEDIRPVTAVETACIAAKFVCRDERPQRIKATVMEC